MPIKIRKTRRKQGERMRRYTPGTRTITKTLNPGGGYTTTSSSTPGYAEYRQAPSSGGNPYPMIEGGGGAHPGIAITMAAALFIFATWHNIFRPFIDSAMNNKPLPTQYPWQMGAGALLFIIIIGVIASTGPTGSSIMIWMLVAMWLLFIMFNGAPQMASFFGWFQGGTPTSNVQSAAINVANSVGTASSNTSQQPTKTA